MLAVRAVFAELNGMYPSAAGIRLWMTRAMNDRLSLIIALTLMLIIVLVIAADAFIIGKAMAYAFHSGPALAFIYVAVLLAAATWLNLQRRGGDPAEGHPPGPCWSPSPYWQ